MTLFRGMLGVIILVISGMCSLSSGAETNNGFKFFVLNGQGHPTATNEVRLGQTLDVQVEDLETVQSDKSKIALVLNGIPLRGTCLDVITNEDFGISLRFNLKRAETCQLEWAQLFGEPTSRYRSNLTVGVMIGDGKIVQSSSALAVEVIPYWGLLAWIAGFVLYLILLFCLAKHHGMLRDSGPKPMTGEKPYSLALVQMAFWFSLVIPSFIFLWITTGGKFDTLNKSALALIGIGTFTAVAAKVQNDNKKQTNMISLEARKRELEALAPPTPGQINELNDIDKKLAAPEAAPLSEGFLADILTDAAGVSFHRFQMFVWTIVLGIIFLAEVWHQLAMPEFDGALLGLMGISSGTYLGFMLTEPYSLDQSKTTAAQTKATPTK